MSVPTSNLLSFGHCYVQDKDIIRIVSQIDSLNQSGNPNTSLLKHQISSNKGLVFNTSWYMTRICLAKNGEQALYGCGLDGKILVLTPQGPTEENVDTSKGGPRVNGEIRDIRWIDGSVYAAGMGRQVYRRDGSNQWTHIDSTILAPLSTEEVKGFNAIDGASHSDIVCVGFDGEIFSWNGATWSQEESPTNVILNQVKFFENGAVYVVGQMGTVLQRKDGFWHIVEQDVTKEQFWDVDFFNGEFYFSTKDALYRMDNEGEFHEVMISPDEKITFGFLHANDGILLSSGVKDVWWTEDGKNWKCWS